MLILRALGLVAALAVLVGVALWLATGNRRYLRFALRLLAWGVAAALLLFGLLMLERLIVLV